MTTTLLLQSEIQDPYAIYTAMLNENPVYWDEENQLWAVYSYQHCTQILHHEAATIPPIPVFAHPPTNEYVHEIRTQLARISNGRQHVLARASVKLLYDNMKKVQLMNIMDEIVPSNTRPFEMDWVQTIGRKLPALAILRSFGFDNDACQFISDNMETLVGLMQPAKDAAAAVQMNEITKSAYTLTKLHLQREEWFRSGIEILFRDHGIAPDQAISCLVSNLLGLLIQSCDAGRGILSNSMLAMLAHTQDGRCLAFLEKLVTETLRYDPPVQNTRRLAAEDIVLNDLTIRKGETIWLVLAAANRDPWKFSHPNQFDTERANNADHLTFGEGHHKCIASSMAAGLAKASLYYFLARNKTIRLLNSEIEYEARINLRLPRNIYISIS